VDSTRSRKPTARYASWAAGDVPVDRTVDVVAEQCLHDLWHHIDDQARPVLERTGVLELARAPLEQAVAHGQAEDGHRGVGDGRKPRPDGPGELEERVLAEQVDGALEAADGLDVLLVQIALVGRHGREPRRLPHLGEGVQMGHAGSRELGRGVKRTAAASGEVTGEGGQPAQPVGLDHVVDGRPLGDEVLEQRNPIGGAGSVGVVETGVLPRARVAHGCRRYRFDSRGAARSR